MATEGWGKSGSMLKKEKTETEDQTQAQSTKLEAAQQPLESTKPVSTQEEAGTTSVIHTTDAVTAGSIDSGRKEPQPSSITSTIRSERKGLTTPKREIQESGSIDEERATRQVIAVSASKGPSAFFNLARKFLVTDEMCDLSALEGAIVSAVDAAHLLERSKLAQIVRIQTSYVAVGPKRKKSIQGMTTPSLSDQAAIIDSRSDTLRSGDGNKLPTVQYQNMYAPEQSTSSTSLPSMSFAKREDSYVVEPSSAKVLGTDTARIPTAPGPRTTAATSQPHIGKAPNIRQNLSSGSGAHKELRRARIVITVKRTEDYKRWLDDNPHQDAISASEDFTEATSSVDLPPEDPSTHS